MRTPSNFTELIRLFLGIINPLLIILVGLALLAFFKGLIAFIYNSGDQKNHEAGRNLMIWGLVGIFVMVSFLGILRMAYRDLGFKNFGLPSLPTDK